MVLSLNVTRICLHILRDGLLDTRLFLGTYIYKSYSSAYSSLYLHKYIRRMF